MKELEKLIIKKKQELSKLNWRNDFFGIKRNTLKNIIKTLAR